MKPSFALDYHRSEIRGVVAAHRASNPRVFGSVVRGEDAEDSDLDLLIDPTPDMTLFDLGAIRHELPGLLGGRRADAARLARKIPRGSAGRVHPRMNRDAQRDGARCGDAQPRKAPVTKA
jgi:predicted nucleotidyltransferase